LSRVSGVDRRERSGRSELAVGIIRSLRETLSVWRSRRRARSQLAAMSDRELQDIGTCRSEIAEDLDKPFWRA
jgi:uncharacterized protein YjiS (DUF1127 family)